MAEETTDSGNEGTEAGADQEIVTPPATPPTVPATDAGTGGSNTASVPSDELAKLITLLQEQDSSNKALIQALSDKLDLTQAELSAFRKWAEENPEIEVQTGIPAATPIAPATAGETTTVATESATTEAGSTTVQKPKSIWERIW